MIVGVEPHDAPWTQVIPIAGLAISLGIWVVYLVGRLGGRDPLQGPSLPPPVWTELDLAIVLGVFVGVQMGTAVAYMAVDPAARFVHALPQMGPHTGPRPSPLMWLMTLNSAGSVVLGLTIVAVTLRRRAGRVAQLGLTTARPLRAAVSGVAGYVAVAPFVFGVYEVVKLLYRLFERRMTPHPIEKALGGGQPPELMIAAVVVALVVAPIVEELFFRGFLQGWLRARVGRLLAIALTAILFGMVHPPQTIPPLIILGLALGYLYDRTGSLLAPITLHFVFNLVSAVTTLVRFT